MAVYARVNNFMKHKSFLYASRCCTQKQSNLKDTSPIAISSDLIGPPDSVSNLRPIIFATSENETNLEKKFREAREDTQIWNQSFWSKHNSTFILERKKFQENLKAKGKESITADDMSVFYKKFLDKNWRTHFNYNVGWYKRNFNLLLLEIRVRLAKLKFK
ncbi:COA8 family protein CG14806, mitochondrial [Prorops nasuta]|uniref:COA8 family protein CG14806, mitochondrial n=1 Tax=Prorops nasuta TaxID=863751 RepID=UPI0034CF80B3